MSKSCLNSVCLLALLPLAACQPRQVDEVWLPPRALAASQITWKPAQLRVQNTDVSVAAEVQPKAAARVIEALTLTETISLVLKYSPELADEAWQVRLREAEQLQAKLRPNPRAKYMIENVGRESSDGFDNHSFRLSQVIELAGKRKKRIALAGANQKLAAWDYETKRLAVITQAAMAYVDVLAAQDQLSLARRNLKLVQSVHDIVKERVAAKRLAEMQLDQARVRLSMEQIALSSARTKLHHKKHTLMTLWGDHDVRFERAVGDLSELKRLAQLPDLAHLEQRMRAHPDLARWQDEYQQRARAIQLAIANRTQNVTAGAGVRHFPDQGEAGALIELSMALPLTDRNQGQILRMKYEMAEARTHERQTQAELTRDLVNHHANLKLASQTLDLLNSDSLPAAQRAYAAAKEAFEKDRTSYLNVLETERTRLQVEQSLIEVRRDYHLAVAALEGLVAGSLEADM